MAPARDRLRDAIAVADIRDADIPVVLQCRRQGPRPGADWGPLLSAQLSSPVRWKHCLQTMSTHGVTDFAELGPGGVLTGMAKRSVDGARTISVATPDDLDKLLDLDRRRDGCAGARDAKASTSSSPNVSWCHRRPASSHPLRLEPGAAIQVGTVLGHVGEHEVRSPFQGALQNYIAVDTERVTSRQPIAWLRTS